MDTKILVTGPEGAVRLLRFNTLLKTFEPNWYYFQARCHVTFGGLAINSGLSGGHRLVSNTLAYISGLSVSWFCLCMKTGGNLHNFGLAYPG